MTITELKALEARATKGPWRQCTRNIAHLVADRPAGEYQPVISSHFFIDNDLILSAALRNAAPHLLAVAEAAKQLRLIQWQRETDEAEHAASGRTFSISHIAKAESDLDATLTALENA